jgi:hypothetical protein
MRKYNCDRVVWDASVGHHWSVVEYIDLSEALVYCADCEEEVTIPLVRSAETVNAACNNPNIQVVFWMRVPEGVRYGKN